MIVNSTNRAVLLTALEPAAIAVVNIAGPGVREFFEQRFSRRVMPMRCVHGELRDGNRVIDDPVIVLHENGLSADINLHGGPWVVQTCLDLLRRDGFEIEANLSDSFDVAAMDSEDIFEREMLSHLWLAKSDLALRALLAQPQMWKTLLASAPSRQTLEARLNDRALWWLLHPPSIAIVGAANVGKSTLANQLFAQQHSITADVPGTTRDWVGQIANIDGLLVTLIDTPGIRKTDDPIERAAIDRATAPIRSADLTVVVLDLTRSMELQRDLFERFNSAIRIANKCDLTAEWDARTVNAIPIVATIGAGIDALRKTIRRYFLGDHADVERAMCWTQRQRDWLASSDQRTMS